MRRFGIEHPVFSRFLQALPLRDTSLASRSFEPQKEWLSQCSSDWRDTLGCSPTAGVFMGCPRNEYSHRKTKACLFWCPHGWPEGQLTSLCSSRLGHRLHHDAKIANAIRNYFVTAEENQWVLTAEQTTLASPLSRGCQLFQIPRLHFQPFPKKISKGWLLHSIQSGDPHVIKIWFDGNTASGDELLFSICDQLRILFIRSNGTIEGLTRNSTPDTGGPQLWKLVHGAAGGSAKSMKKANDRLIAWHLLSPQDRLPSKMRDCKPEIKVLGDWQIDFLSHWTRLNRKPWPDRNALTQFDRLFLEGPSAMSPLTTLLRILTTQKILASGSLIPQKQRMVCFTEVPLTEFPQRRIYRPHLSRWDFEPWGISIRKSMLRRFQAKPVHYESNEPKIHAKSPRKQSAEETAFQQSEVWASEREWRVIGDLDLRHISTKDAVVFVPDLTAARALAPYSRWPFTIVDSAYTSA